MSKFLTFDEMGDIVRKHYPNNLVIADMGFWHVLNSKTYMADVSIDYPGENVTEEEYEKLVELSKL